jgi:integrase
MAFAARKSITWVSAQLGHSNPAFTLQTYGHLVRDEETDHSFAT